MATALVIASLMFLNSELMCRTAFLSSWVSFASRYSTASSWVTYVSSGISGISPFSSRRFPSAEAEATRLYDGPLACADLTRVGTLVFGGRTARTSDGLPTGWSSGGSLCEGDPPLLRPLLRVLISRRLLMGLGSGGTNGSPALFVARPAHASSSSFVLKATKSLKTWTANNKFFISTASIFLNFPECTIEGQKFVKKNVLKSKKV